MADHLYMRYNDQAILCTMPMRESRVRAEAETLWIEFKSASGKPKKHQVEWHDKERARGALTWIAGVDFPASIEGFRAHYRASGLNRGSV